MSNDTEDERIPCFTNAFSFIHTLIHIFLYSSKNTTSGNKIPITLQTMRVVPFRSIYYDFYYRFMRVIDLRRRTRMCKYTQDNTIR